MTYSFTAREKQHTETLDKLDLESLFSFFKKVKKKTAEEQGEKTASSKCFREAGVCSQRISLETTEWFHMSFSYELRSGEDSLEREKQKRDS